MDRIVQRLKMLKDNGGARLQLRELNIERNACLKYFDSSFAQEQGLSSQCGVFSVLTDREVVICQVVGNLAVYESNTIRRVARSTMAAESAARSKSLVRQ